jgi:hypothetical protein
MAKPERFKVAKRLIENGSVKTLRDLLELVDKRHIYMDIPTSAIRFNKLIDNPEQFMFRDAYAIAVTIGVDEKLILDLIHAEYLSRKKKKK